MAYGKKYILSLISDRGNDYRVEILQQGYTGAAVNKSFGTVPTLSIEEGDGRIKGSSLAFSIQADAEGELSGLYTTNNKEYKVLLYRNSTLYWQGYLLPELYSENYVDPPFDVAVTATDQLATLKDVEYQGEDVLTSLLDIIKGILLNTKVDIPCTIHMQLSSAQGALLQNSYISAANYNGQNCYDVLNAILLSCNSSIMQMGNRWLIASLTDASIAYTTDGASENIPFTTIGQMGKADVCPDGSLVMVNSPAFKGATVEYNHTLRKSMLLNPDVVNRDNWNYNANTIGDRFPGEIQGVDVVYKCHFFQLNQVNLQKDHNLQVWQDIALGLDTANAYSLSVKHMFSNYSEVLLMSVVYSSEYGTSWYLTAEGWKTDVDRENINSYIQITGNTANSGLLQEVADISKYETATVQFMLPDVPGTLRVGFINCTTDYTDPEPYKPSQIFITGVYLTIASVTGKTSTTLVEANATTGQEEIAITFGESVDSVNAEKLDLSYLRTADGQKIESIILSGREYPSYYLAMVQDFSRYYGVKKMQLQGALMGTDVLSYLYKDVFSGKVCRLLGGQYNLLDDSISVNLEEVPTAFVDYNLVVYAKENTSKNDTTTAGGAVAVGGGDSHIGVQADGDAYVKNDRPLLGKESRFENVALPTAEPERVVERTYIYSSDPSKYPSVNLTAMSDTMVTLQSGLTDISRRVTDLEKLFYYDEEHDAVRTSMSLIIDKWITFGGVGMGQGTVTGATELDGLNDVQITRPEGGQVLMYDEDLGLWVNKAGGVSGDYLPLSGGTLSGSLRLGDYNSSTYLDVAVLRNNISAFMGVEGTQGAVFGYSKNGDVKSLVVDFSGLLYDNNGTQYPLIHSGNIGQYITGGGTAAMPLNPEVIQFKNEDGSLGGWVGQGSGGNNHMFLYADDYSDLKLYTGGVQRLLINSGGAGVYEGYSLMLTHTRYWGNDAGQQRNPTLGHLNDGTIGFTMQGYHYGLFTWTNWSSGDSNLQVGRADGHAYAYNMRLQPLGGNVIIGNSDYDDSGDRLQVYGSHIYTTGLHSPTGGYIWWNDKGIHLNPNNGSETPNAVNILNNGNVLIGEYIDKGAKLYVNGNFVVTGSVTFNMASDRRLKDNIKPLTIRDTMRVLHRLKPVSFEWNEIAFSLDNTKEGLCDGFLADEYEKLIPNSGRAIWEKYRAIDYTRAIPYLARGWQIHESELDKMRKKVKTMEKEIAQLKKTLNEHNITAA